MTTQLKTEITGFLKVSAPETLIVAAGNLAILTIYLIGSELNSRPAVLCSRVNFSVCPGYHDTFPNRKLQDDSSNRCNVDIC